MHKRFVDLVLLFAMTLPAWGASTAGAQPVVSGTISCQQVAADSWTYSMSVTVDPSSPESVLSLWFAWVPLYDFLPSHPTFTGSPAGWTGVDTPDEYGVSSEVWSTTFDPIAPGQTLSGFTFTTPDPPSEIIDALYEPLDLPVTTTYAYSYPEHRGDYTVFVPTYVASVPEPATMLIPMLGMAALLKRKSWHLHPGVTQ